MTLAFHPQRRRWRQRGFTLVEAIVVMVITGILAGTMVLFIQRSVRAYVDSAARADLSDTADLALRRMARELRSALPNSIRVASANGVWWLEFIPTRGGARYLAVEDNADPALGTPLSFTDTTANTNPPPFSVVGPMPGPLALAVGDMFVIYNLGPGFDYADAYGLSNLALVTSITVSNGNSKIGFGRHPASLATPLNVRNPFALAAANGAPPNASPAGRFQVVAQPVTFRCQGLAGGGGTLSRHSGYGFISAQPLPGAAGGQLLANNVLSCAFDSSASGSRQSALISLSLTLARPLPDAGNSVESVTLVDQIHVDNTP